MSQSAFSVYIKNSKKRQKHMKKIHDQSLNGRPQDRDLVMLQNDILEDDQRGRMIKAPLVDLSVPYNGVPQKQSSKKKKAKQEIVQSADENPSISSTSAVSTASFQKKIKMNNALDDDTVKSSDICNNITNFLNGRGSTLEKATNLLKWILYPLQVNSFFESHWETQPVHIIRNQPDYFKTLFTSGDIDLMLREHPLHFGRNVDIVEYKDGARETMNPIGRATPSIVWDAYSQGCSVRILNPQTYNDTIYFILATLQEYFGTMVGANIYLTPAGAQGFAPHYDDIEAFIIQLEGKKHWKLYKPVKDCDNLARYSSNDFNRDQLGDIVFDAVLNTGDILYFPRGTVHEAKAVANEPSLHMTISSYQCTSYVDILEAMLPKALEDSAGIDIEFRKGLPINYLKHVGTTSLSRQTPERLTILKTIQKLFLKMINNLDVDAAADVLGKRFMHDALPPVLESSEKLCSSKLDGDKLKDGRVTNRIELTLQTRIRLVRYHACHLTKEKGEGVLYFSTQNARVYHGEDEQFITFNLEYGVIIEILQLHYPDFIVIDQFPIDDKKAVLTFVTQLWDYGIIITSKPAS